MWFPFRRKKRLPVPVPRPRKAMKRVIVGFIIGGAISSIIGARMMQKSKDDELKEAPDDQEREAKED